MGHFLPFYASPPKNPTNEIFEKIKQIAGYIIRLHMCTKKTQLYGVQSLRYRVRQTMFCPFFPQTTEKNDILKKKNLRMSSFYICVPKITIIWCLLLEIWSTTDTIFCHFRLLFALLLPQQPRKSKFRKNRIIM